MKLTEYAKDISETQFGIWIQSGYDNERENQLAIYFGRRCWWFKLDKAIVKPTEKWVDMSHYDWAKPGPDGRCGYTKLIRKHYGFSLHPDCIRIFHGENNDCWPDPGQSSWYFPWAQMRRVRHEFLDADGDVVVSASDKPNGALDFDALRAAEEMVPKLTCKMLDFDKKTEVTAKIYQTESQYRYGEKWAKFVGYLVPSKTYRHIHVDYDKETGPKRGSWKGGTTGYTAPMLNGESLEEAFYRLSYRDGFSDIKFVR